MKYSSPFIALVAIVGLGFIIFMGKPPHVDNTGTPIATINYRCSDKKSLEVKYYEGETKPAKIPDGPPTPGGSVELRFDDDSMRTLLQTISADGVRYSDGDPTEKGSESYVFWSKGRGALILTGKDTQSYVSCIEVVADPGYLSEIYVDHKNGLSIRYPAGATVDETYQYQGLGSEKNIPGAKITIPLALAEGTNLSKDSYFSIERQKRDVSGCSAEAFYDKNALSGKEVATTTENGAEYSVASTTDAAVGNRYEEIVYAYPTMAGCIGLRYFIHSTAIENYPPGTIRAFDRTEVMDLFDAMRKTFVSAL